MNKSKNINSLSVDSSAKKTSNTPLTQKEIQLSDVLLIKDLKERNKSFNQLITHVLLKNCSQNNCHNLSQLLSELASNLTKLMTCDESIDRLMAEFIWTQNNDNNDIENSCCQLICETINLKPFKCEQMLEKIIIPKFKGLKEFKDDNDVNSEELLMFNKIHSILSKIKIVKLEETLIKIIEKKFPFGPTLTVHSHTCYVFNTLKVCEYVVDKERLLDLVFDKLLWIDSILTLEKIYVEPEIFTIEDCNQPMTDPNILMKIQTLDNSLGLILKFIDENTNDLSSKQSKQIFWLFQQSFNKIVLNAENCLHLQYIIFYLCSISKSFCEEFIQNLWNTGLNNELKLKSRIKSFFYMSSLLKSAKFITTNIVLSFMDMISHWVNSFIDLTNTSVDVINSDYITFYVLCEVLFDTFCYFHEDFDNLHIRRVKVMNFQRIIKSKLNPLSFCCRDISLKFLHLATHYQIAYSSQIANRDDQLISEYSFDHLNSFNGFGIYLLPKSRTKFQDICRQSINKDNEIINQTDKYHRFTSDDSDNMIGSHKMSYSPSKTLFYDLLNNTSEVELME